MAPSISRLADISDQYESISVKKRKLDSRNPVGEYSAPGIESSAIISNPSTELDTSPNSVKAEDTLEAPVLVTDGLIAHPLGVKPLGNALGDTVNVKNLSGLFASLPDELLIEMLEYLSPRELTYLGSTCRALYAFCRLDELWKSLYLQYVPSH